MKTILIMRHAHAESAAHGLDDHDRPLTEQGAQLAGRVGRLLHDEGLTPDTVICSTAVRARSTADAVAETSGFGSEVRSTRRLYDASAMGFVQVLRAAPDVAERLLVVGHNPGAAELLRLLTGKVRAMAPGAMARIVLPIRSWSELDEDTAGRLTGFWGPGDLGD